MTWQQAAAALGLLAIPWLHGFLGAAAKGWDEHHWNHAHTVRLWSGKCSRCSRLWTDLRLDDGPTMLAFAQNHVASGECIGADSDPN